MPDCKTQQYITNIEYLYSIIFISSDIDKQLLYINGKFKLPAVGVPI